MVTEFRKNGRGARDATSFLAGPVEFQSHSEQFNKPVTLSGNATLPFARRASRYPVARAGARLRVQVAGCAYRCPVARTGARLRVQVPGPAYRYPVARTGGRLRVQVPSRAYRCPAARTGLAALAAGSRAAARQRLCLNCTAGGWQGHCAC